MPTAWIADLLLAWRGLRRSPGFLATSVVTLALAIGAAVGMFSVVNAVLLRPLPYPQPDRLVAVAGNAPGLDLPERFNLGFDFYLEYKERSQLLDGIFTFGYGTSTFRADDRVERIPMGFPSVDMWSTLGVAPQLGRAPTEADENVMVISDRLWADWFGRDSAVLGRTYFAGGEVRQIIGVMPPEFFFPDDNALLWVLSPVRLSDVQPGNLGVPLIARMKSGVTTEQLATELTQISKGLPDRFGGSANYARLAAAHRAVVEPASEVIVDPTVRTSLWVLLGGVGIVLLIACANVTNLFLVRVEGRQRDLAVRRALGAKRGRLVGLQLAEGLVVALVAGALAVLVSALALPAFLRAAPEGIPRLLTVGVDAPVLLAALGLVLVAAMACSVVPALRASAPDLRRLREGGRTGTGRSRWGRDLLVIGQTALALVLLIGSALLVRSFQNLRAVDPGYDTANIYTFQFAPEQPQLVDGPSWGRLHLDVMDRVRALPGVEAVGVVNNIPLDEGTGFIRYLTESMAPEDAGVLLNRNFAGGDYFQVMGISLLQGRPFNSDEAVTPNFSVMVSRSAADRLWPDADPIGQRLRRPGQEHVYFVVGVVEDVKQDDWRDAGEEVVYHPLTGPTADFYGMSSPAYVVKSPRAASLTREVRDLVRQVAPEAPVYREFTMDFLARRAMVQLRFTMLTLGVVSVLALILGAVGLYGVLSYVVAERTREIGVRMALGASAATVQRMVVGQGAKVVAIGVGIGLIAAALSSRALGSILFGVSALSPLVYAAMALLLLGVALVATYLPARRASTVDPMESLRAD